MYLPGNQSRNYHCKNGRSVLLFSGIGCRSAAAPSNNVLLTMQLKDAGTTSLTRRLKNVIWSELCGGRRE